MRIIWSPLAVDRASERDQVKQTLSERFFAQPEVATDSEKVDARSLLDIIKQVMMTLLKK